MATTKNIKVTEATGTVRARLATPVQHGGNNDLGLQVRDDGFRRRLLLDVTRAHNMNHTDDTIVATVKVHRGEILKLAEQLKAEDEQHAAHNAYPNERMQENKRAGRPFMEGAITDGKSFVFPPRSGGPDRVGHVAALLKGKAEAIATWDASIERAMKEANA